MILVGSGCNWTYIVVFLRGHRPGLYPGGVVKCGFNVLVVWADFVDAYRV